MCITANQAELTGTFISSNVVGRDHRLIYQNETETEGNNAMILAIPGEIKKLKAYPKGWVSDLYNRLNPITTRSMFNEKSMKIERVGSYIVGNTTSLSHPTAIDFCKQHGLEINQKMIDWFHQNYDGWSYVIAVFKPENTGEMHPIAIDYHSFEWLEDIAYIPLVEGHGEVPKLLDEPTQKIHQTVIVNNIIIIGDKKASTTNDDLYVMCNVIPEFTSSKMYNRGQLHFEQCPRNLSFYGK